MIIELKEYGRQLGVELTAGQAQALQRSRAVTVSPSFEFPGAWDLRAAQYVGVVVADEVELRIQPKIDFGRLLFLVTYARDEGAWTSEVVDLVVQDDLVASMGFALAHHAEAAMARGVLQGYVTVEEALPGLRGRFREADQLRRHFGILVPVEVTYDDYTIDIRENRLLLAASERLLALPTLSASLRRRLRHLVVRLDGVGPLRREDLVCDVNFTRLNERYCPAVRLSQAVLLGASLEFGVGRRPGVAFLFDMNRVFEDFVTSTLTSELECIGGRVEPQASRALDRGGAIEIKPDLVWWSRGVCRAVVDIKYKATRVDEVPNADVYQVMAYCLGFDVRPGFLIYATGNEEPGHYGIVHSDLEVVVTALDISGQPGAILASVKAMAEIIAGRTSTQPVEVAGGPRLVESAVGS